MTAKVRPTRDGWGYSCRPCGHRASGWQFRPHAQESADAHNQQAHEHELQERADIAAAAWLGRGGKGRIPAGAFKLWASPQCAHGRKLHPMRTHDVCLDCGYALDKLTGEEVGRELAG